MKFQMLRFLLAQYNTRRKLVSLYPPRGSPFLVVVSQQRRQHFAAYHRKIQRMETLIILGASDIVPSDGLVESLGKPVAQTMTEKVLP